MRAYERPVREYMVAPVSTVRDDSSLVEADRSMRALGVSALPVVNGSDIPVGVVSRTDLLRAGRSRLDAEGRPGLFLPDVRVAGARHAGVEIVSPDALVSEVGRRMADSMLHRLYVAEDRRLVGVVSTREMMRAVVDAGDGTPLRTIMTERVVTVGVSEPTSLAVDVLAEAPFSGLLVLDADGAAVGTFGPEEALAVRNTVGTQDVGTWMDPAILHLPEDVTARDAAEAALASPQPRRIGVVRGETLVGVVTGTDFARLVGGSR